MSLLKASDLISSQIEHINRIGWLLFMGKVFAIFSVLNLLNYNWVFNNKVESACSKNAMRFFTLQFLR